MLLSIGYCLRLSMIVYKRAAAMCFYFIIIRYPVAPTSRGARLLCVVYLIIYRKTRGNRRGNERGKRREKKLKNVIEKC